MKKKIIIIVSLVMVALIGLAVAGGPHWYGPKSAQARVDYVKAKLTDTLDLTDTQVSTLDQIAADILAEHDRMEVRHDEFKDRFFEVLNQESVAPEDLTRLFEEKKPHIDRLMQLAATHIAEFHSILTPEQRTRLMDEMENHRHGCRFGRWSTPTQEIEGK